MCKKELQESFDQQSLYIHNKFKKKMLKTQERREVYIVEKIVKDLDEFVLFSAIYHDSACSININTAFSSMQNDQIDVVDSMNVNVNLINVSADLTNNIIQVN